ncbi:uncharacterized protein LOC117307255 [Asterias rubens]|uniref:uncharacterized protein LOC117307255 n=1 Tax=Asterias rubens TaxID=7604 RepID=UPI001455ABC4|nr:uncharacterized protein LOC117307255 [Asterias rubens]
MASSVVGVLTDISDEPSLSGKERLFIHEIQIGATFGQKYIKCKINKKFALYSSEICTRMKLILEEAEDEVGMGSGPPARISLFLNGAFAEEFVRVNDTDTVVISQAIISKSSHFRRDGIHPCIIDVDIVKSKPSVWVIPAKKQKPAEPQVCNNPRRRNTQGARARLFPEATTSEEEVSSSRAAPSTTSAPPNVSISAITGRNVEQSNVITAGRAMDAWTVPKHSPSKANYAYTLLKDLRVTSKVNIFGVVKFFKPPYKTRGPDYCMMVTLIDPSLVNDQRGFRCQLFRDELEALPQIHSIGDIVRFHRLRVTEFNGNMQGQRGDGFQCLVFGGGLNDSDEPRASTSNFTLTSEDKDRVKELRQWTTRCTQLTLDIPYCTLERCYSGQYFDLACQVISVAILPAESCVVVKVWDSTKIKCPTRVMDISKATNVMNRPTLADRAEGLSVDVSLYDNHMEAGKLLKPGQYIKLCNLHATNWRDPGQQHEQEEKSILELVLHKGTSYGRGVLLLRPDKEKQVKEMISRMDQIAKDFGQRRAAALQAASAAASAAANNQSTSGTRPKDSTAQIASTATTSQLTTGTRPMDAQAQMASAATANPSTSGTRPVESPGMQARTDSPSVCMQRSASVVNYTFHQKITRLQDVIQSKSPNKFRIRAKVADYLPNDANDFVHLHCSVCKFRCKVPSNIKPRPTQSECPSEKSNSKKEERNQRTGLQESDGLTDSRGRSRRIQTRSASQRRAVATNAESRVGMVTRSRQSEDTGDSSSADSSPSRPVKPRGRRLRAKKRPASENDERLASESTTQKENLPGTSKSTASDKTMTVTTSRGVTITVKIPSSSEDEEVDGGKSRKKIRVEVGRLTLTEALLLNRRGMTLFSHPYQPTGIDREGSDPELGDKVHYACPKCFPINDENPQAAIPDDATLLEYRYCMKLILDDGTASIDVIVDGEHGETFFQGIPVDNLYTSPDTKFMLEKVMAKLCPFPIGQGFDSPDEDTTTAIGDHMTHPWLECCIFAYPVHMGNEEVIKYKMFDTSLALDVE